VTTDCTDDTEEGELEEEREREREKQKQRDEQPGLRKKSESHQWLFLRMSCVKRTMKHNTVMVVAPRIFK
jgi:hypothetical protein